MRICTHPPKRHHPYCFHGAKMHSQFLLTMHSALDFSLDMQATTRLECMKDRGRSTERVLITNFSTPPLLQSSWSRRYNQERTWQNIYPSCCDPKGPAYYLVSQDAILEVLAFTQNLKRLQSCFTVLSYWIGISLSSCHRSFICPHHCIQRR